MSAVHGDHADSDSLRLEIGFCKMKLAVTAGEKEIIPTGFGEFLKECTARHQHDKVLVELVRDLSIHMLNHLIMQRKKLISLGEKSSQNVEMIKRLEDAIKDMKTDAIKDTIVSETETGIKAANVIESDEEVCSVIEWNDDDWELIQNDNPNLTGSGPEVFII